MVGPSLNVIKKPKPKSGYETSEMLGLEISRDLRAVLANTLPLQIKRGSFTLRHLPEVCNDYRNLQGLC